METNIFGTGISDHQKIVSTIMNLHFSREIFETRYYRDYSKSNIDYFSSELFCQLNSTFCSVKKNEGCEELHEFSRFHRVFLNLPNIQAPLKVTLMQI